MSIERSITRAILVSGISLFCGLLSTAVAQNTTTVSPDDGYPYGGAELAAGSIPAGPQSAGSGDAASRHPKGLDGTDLSGACPSPNPCVLTGQNDRYRSSTNVSAHQLAAFGSSNAPTFGLAYFYQLPNPTGHLPFTSFPYEPVFAQPLYVTHVLNGGVYKDFLIVATVNNYVYAYDASSSGSTTTPVWQVNLNSNCGTTGGQPFENVFSGQPGAVTQLEYYGIVATPVIDTAPSTPFLLVVSACTASGSRTTIQWNLDAIALTDGTVSTGHTIISDGTTFQSSNQLSRSSLLLTHPAAGGTFVYVAFGSGAAEIGAAITPTGYPYSGVLFGYYVSYHTSQPYVTFDELYPTSSSSAAAPFYTSGGTTASFPSVYAGTSTSDYPLGPGCATPGGNCSPGSNWSVNNGGIWMTSKGPSSDGNAFVFVAAGNGPFGCNNSGASDCDGVSSCTDPSSVLYWGESAIKFPSAVVGTDPAPDVMGTPTDFFAPYVQRYVCPYGDSSCTGASMPNVGGATDPAPACYQTEELSRLDLDFGTSGMVLAPKTVGSTTHLFALTSDKMGMLYVMPAAGGLGYFQPGDAGLTGSSLTYTTQTPFQLPRYPTFATPTCETINSTGTDISGSCDEVHEFAYLNSQDMGFAWPLNEAIEGYTASLSNGNDTYSFNTTRVDPCSVPGQCTCSGTNCTPQFPTYSNPGSGGFAIAANNTVDPKIATLWGAIPQSNFGTGSTLSSNWGQLFAYTVNSDASLTWIWDSVNGHKCSSPPAGGWYVPSFTEPTLAAWTNSGGTNIHAVYVPSTCVVTGSNLYASCYSAGQAGNGDVASGVLTFTTCP